MKFWKKVHNPYKNNKLEKIAGVIILERLYLEEDLFGNGRIECTENCAVMHSFLCIWEPG